MQGLKTLHGEAAVLYAVLHKLQFVKYRAIILRGVIVPHRNRTKSWGGVLSNGQDACCPSVSNGRDARCPSCTAKMAAFPVSGGRGTTALPDEAARAPNGRDRRGHSRCSAFSLHGGSGFPTRRSGCSLCGTSQIAIFEVARNHPEWRDCSAP